MEVTLHQGVWEIHTQGEGRQEITHKGKGWHGCVKRPLSKVVLKRHRSLESDDAAKVARHVREGAVGKGLRSGYHLDSSGQVGAYVGTSLAVYFMSAGEQRPGKASAGKPYTGPRDADFRL